MSTTLLVCLLVYGPACLFAGVCLGATMNHRARTGKSPVSFSLPKVFQHDDEGERLSAATSVRPIKV